MKSQFLLVTARILNMAVYDDFSKLEILSEINKNRLLKVKILHKAPNNDMIPQAAQTHKHAPTLPEYFNASVGEMKIPLPIITPNMTFTAAVRPRCLCKPTFVSFSGDPGNSKINYLAVNFICIFI
jgi:hypothetical protein